MDRFILSGQNELEMLQTRYAIRRDRMVIIPTPIDLEIYRPIDRATACLIAELDPMYRYILFVGRLADGRKRVSAVLKCFAKLAERHPDVRLVIVGDRPDAKVLRKQAAKLAPGRVEFRGWVSGPDRMAHFYNAAECLFLPSRNEGFSSVIGESLACGTPVVPSRVGGSSEVVLDGHTGWLIEPGDDSALLGLMAFTLEHPAAIAPLRAQARKMGSSDWTTPWRAPHRGGLSHSRLG